MCGTDWPEPHLKCKHLFICHGRPIKWHRNLNFILLLLLLLPFYLCTIEKKQWYFILNIRLTRFIFSTVLIWSIQIFYHFKPATRIRWNREIYWLIPHTQAIELNLFMTFKWYSYHFIHKLHRCIGQCWFRNSLLITIFILLEIAPREYNQCLNMSFVFRV